MVNFKDEEIKELRHEEEVKYLPCLYRPVVGRKRGIRPRAGRHGRVKVFTQEEITSFSLRQGR